LTHGDDVPSQGEDRRRKLRSQSETDAAGIRPLGLNLYFVRSLHML
jgi:hypothetical protein